MKKINIKIFEDRIKFWTEKAKKSATKPLADKANIRQRKSIQRSIQ